MKKALKYIKQNIFGFIIGGLLFGSIGVYAVTVIAANNVVYSDNNNLGATNVQDAIDKLNSKATTKIKEAKEECPVGYKCEKLPKLCKRATILHTETCGQTASTYYCSGDGYTANGSMKTTTITYGNLGTKGVLTSGDAFDCDVNGDGKYEPATERFYYVSDMTNGITKNSNVAVLIYYNNVSGGLPSNSTSYTYYSSSKENWHGPVTAIKQLPTTSQWKNVSLTNTKRQITTQTGTTSTGGGNLPTTFDYSLYAARLLTYQEVYNGCYDGTIAISSAKGLSTKCKYLMENTKYSSDSLKTYGCWLETPYTSNSTSIWSVSSGYRFVDGIYANSTGNFGVRPAIEVAKSNIDY